MSTTIETRTIQQVAPFHRVVLYPEGGLQTEYRHTGIGWCIDDDFELCAMQCQPIADPRYTDNDGAITAGYSVTFCWRDETGGFHHYSTFIPVKLAARIVLRIAEAFDIDTAGIMTGRLCWNY